MIVLDTFLSDRDLTQADGRPLHAYGCTDDEFRQLLTLLQLRVVSGQILDSEAQWFVLWASEHIRRVYSGGSLSWHMVFKGLGLKYARDTTIRLTELGLRHWKRPLRRRESDGSRQFLYSLLVEGGLPDALLSRDSGYSAVVLGTIAELDALLIDDTVAAIRIAERRLRCLPVAFHNDESAWLLAELSLAFVRLRALLPPDLERSGAKEWLEQNHPGWEHDLPLRLSEVSRRLILWPAVYVSVQRRSGTGVIAKRLLCKRSDGQGWIGVVRIQDNSVLPFEMAASIDRSSVFRLVAGSGHTYRATPDQLGWRLSAQKRTDQLIALEPNQSCVFSAYADGRFLGKIVLDAGMPSCEEVPSFWRSEHPDSTDSDVLVPASGYRTKGRHIWALLPVGIQPVAGDGVSIDAFEDAPHGQLWCLSGSGNLKLGDELVSIVTQCTIDDIDAHLVLMGEPLRHWRSTSRLTVYRGSVRTFGVTGNSKLWDVSRSVRIRSVNNNLGGRVYEWVSNGTVRARSRCVVLPDEIILSVREIQSGVVELVGRGLLPEWSITLNAAEVVKHAKVSATGTVQLRLDLCGRKAVDLELLLYNPTSGEKLNLVCLWPTIDPILIDPTGVRLQANRAISLTSLSGWRGEFPDKNGALQLRIAGKGKAVAFGVQGPQRLAAHQDLVSQVMALAGADGRVNLRLVSGGHTPRLEIGRYDWEPMKTKDIVDAGDGLTTFNAITLTGPTEEREIKVTRFLRFNEWLGDNLNTWFVQGRSENGVMRPLAWSHKPIEILGRQERIDAYAMYFRDMLRDPIHTGWKKVLELIRAARRAGDCGALDQVQALSQVPALAVGLLFVVNETEVSEMLELENEAPLWWPLVRIDDWISALALRRRMIISQLVDASFEKREAIDLAEKDLQRRAKVITQFRMELSAHIGAAMSHLGIEPTSLSDRDNSNSLFPRNPSQLISVFASELAARSPEVPYGASGLLPVVLSPPEGFSESIRPLLAAPLVVSEVAVGIAPQPEPENMLKLLALRYADPIWFNIAVPLALNIALQQKPIDLNV